HHKHAFQLVRDNNINVTIHAGEAYGPESIAQAVHTCGAHRIGHGCRLRETVNTDNRLVTDTTVSKELWLCHAQMGLSLKDLKQIILAGFKSAFLPFH